MRRYAMFDGTISLESLDARLSLSSMVPGGYAAPSVCSTYLASDDPLPDPEPSPGPDPGTTTPITPPPLPPSGPMGPGTS